MDIRVQCPCGQAYEFAVEPVNAAMPVPVACPVCGADGTAEANEFIRLSLPATTPPAPPAPERLRINRPPPQAAPPPPVAAAAPRSSPARFPTTARPPEKAEAVSNNLLLGALGALLGAALGAGLMYGFFVLTEIRFPLTGVGIGVLTGLGARIFYRGTDSQLGAVAAVFSLIATAGVLYYILGDMIMLGIISMVVSVSMAWRIAS